MNPGDQDNQRNRRGIGRTIFYRSWFILRRGPSRTGDEPGTQEETSETSDSNASSMTVALEALALPAEDDAVGDYLQGDSRTIIPALPYGSQVGYVVSGLPTAADERSMASTEETPPGERLQFASSSISRRENLRAAIGSLRDGLNSTLARLRLARIGENGRVMVDERMNMVEMAGRGADGRESEMDERGLRALDVNGGTIELRRDGAGGITNRAITGATGNASGSGNMLAGTGTGGTRVGGTVVGGTRVGGAVVGGNMLGGTRVDGNTIESEDDGEDDPTFQQLLLISGIFCGPITFCIGGILYFIIPRNQIRTRRYAFLNLFLSIFSIIYFLISFNIEQKNELNNPIKKKNVLIKFQANQDHLKLRHTLPSACCNLVHKFGPNDFDISWRPEIDGDHAQKEAHEKDSDGQEPAVEKIDSQNLKIEALTNRGKTVLLSLKHSIEDFPPSSTFRSIFLASRAMYKGPPLKYDCTGRFGGTCQGKTLASLLADARLRAATFLDCDFMQEKILLLSAFYQYQSPSSVSNALSYDTLLFQDTTIEFPQLNAAPHHQNCSIQVLMLSASEPVAFVALKSYQENDPIPETPS